MSVIDKLIAAGRDPLEAVLVPPAADVAQWIEDDANEKLDNAIVAELRSWSPEMHARLLVLVERRLTQRATDGATCWACHRISVPQNRDGWCEHWGSPRR